MECSNFFREGARLDDQSIMTCVEGYRRTANLLGLCQIIFAVACVK